MWWTRCERVSVRIVRVLCRDEWLTNRSAMAGGVPTKKILRYLKEASGKVILPKDVQNMIAEMRANAYTSPDVNKRIEEIFQDLCSAPGNVANTFRGDGGKTSCITFQTKLMRTMFRRFPEVLCVDATYGTNSNK